MAFKRSGVRTPSAPPHKASWDNEFRLASFVSRRQLTIALEPVAPDPFQDKDERHYLVINRTFSLRQRFRSGYNGDQPTRHKHTTRRQAPSGKEIQRMTRLLAA